MSTAKELLRDAERCLERIEAARKDLCTIENQVNRLLKPDVLPEGTRVRLKRNWNTPEDMRKSQAGQALCTLCTLRTLQQLKKSEYPVA